MCLKKIFLVITTISLVLTINASPSNSRDTQTCKDRQTMMQSGIELSQGQVLCCCRVSGGGECCKYVITCGSFIPGCFCSNYNKDLEEPVKQSKK